MVTVCAGSWSTVRYAGMPAVAYAVRFATVSVASEPGRADDRLIRFSSQAVGVGRWHRSGKMTVWTPRHSPRSLPPWWQRWPCSRKVVVGSTPTAGGRADGQEPGPASKIDPYRRRLALPRRPAANQPGYAGATTCSANYAGTCVGVRVPQS